MKRQITRWDTGAVIWEGEAETVKDAIHAAHAAKVNCWRANLGGADLRDANLGGANLRGANLGGANLGGANLGDANLRDANLRDANLGDANLRDANLRGADLRGADLRDANLRDANLRDADLGDANLRGANLGDAKNPPAYLPTGETWAEYLTTVVPALLTAGGKSLDSFGEHFECHTWENCPMAHAFSAPDLRGVPALLRPRADQFIQFFDAGLIPWPLPAATVPEATK